MTSSGDAGSGRDPAGDGDIAPLLRWALREQVSGAEPPPAGWQEVRARLIARQMRYARATRHLSTSLSAFVVAVLVLTMSIAYGYDYRSVNSPPSPVVSATVATDAGVESTALSVVAAPAVERAPTPTPASARQPERARPVESAAAVDAVRSVMTTEVLDDALRPDRKLSRSQKVQTSVQPVPVTKIVVRGEAPKPM